MVRPMGRPLEGYERRVPLGHDHGWARRDQIGSEIGQRPSLAKPGAGVNRDVLSVHIAELSQALLERRESHGGRCR
jgi:hypothetical protein